MVVRVVVDSVVEVVRVVVVVTWVVVLDDAVTVAVALVVEELPGLPPSAGW